MDRLWTLAVGGCLLAGAAGCTGLAPPDWRHPGPAAYQQRRAEQFDPYPENEPAPAIVGGRPLQYDRPPAEVLRARWFPWNWAQ
jgi:hypothetical protein